MATPPAAQSVQLDIQEADDDDVVVSMDEVELRNPSKFIIDAPTTTTDPAVPDDDETRRLRLYLRAYFYSAFKWTHNTCSFHLIYCLIIMIQVIKIILISNQMVTFGRYRANFSSAVNRGHVTLRHLLLKDWDSSWESLPYPPSRGDFAVYDISGLEDRINYAVEQYYNAEMAALGFYSRTVDDNMTITMSYFDFPGLPDSSSNSEMIIFTKTFPIVAGLHEHKNSPSNHSTYAYNILEEMEFQNISHPMKRLLALSLDFSLHSVRVYDQVKLAQCLAVTGKVIFNNLDNNGQVMVDLETETARDVCRDLHYNVDDLTIDSWSKAVGGVVIAFSILSLFATFAVMALAVFTFVKTKLYMRKYYRWFYNPVDPDEKDLPGKEYWMFIKLWDLVTILADCFTLHGTMWIVFETQRTTYMLSTLDSYTVTLSLGGLLAWLSLLRYFKFHNKFNLLFNTMYRAFFNVMAYIICVSVLFIGFWLCGYVVMGPYHVKFKTLSTAAETLLSIVNGDEIFFTVANLEQSKTGSSLVFWFSRVYITTYVLIFTIIVINVLIAIFMSSYETVQTYYKEKDEDRELGPVEKALKRHLSSTPSTGKDNLRSSLYSMLSHDGNVTSEEGSLRRELMKLVRVSTASRDVVLHKRRTLKAFYEDGNNKGRAFSCYCLKCYFALISHRND